MGVARAGGHRTPTSDCCITGFAYREQVAEAAIPYCLPYNYFPLSYYIFVWVRTIPCIVLQIVARSWLLTMPWLGKGALYCRSVLYGVKSKRCTDPFLRTIRINKKKSDIKKHTALGIKSIGNGIQQTRSVWTPRGNRNRDIRKTPGRHDSKCESHSK